MRAPTLLVVGGDDATVLDLNRTAMAAIHTGVRLEIVPPATHLFEEPGALEAVAELAREWFVDHLTWAAGRQGPSALARLPVRRDGGPEEDGP